MRQFCPFRRFEGNPIIRREDMPYPCNTVFNAAACRFGDEVLLLLRVEDLRGHSHLTLARSDDGYRFRIDPKPWIEPAGDPVFGPYEEYGVEDPRITPMDDGSFAITYTAFSRHGPRAAIGRTRDFEAFERVALVSEVPNKDAVLFPERVGGDYLMLDRPGGYHGVPGSIWLQRSPDLVHWGRGRVVLGPEPGWGSGKLGASSPPVRTDAGWLVLYHGVRSTGAGMLYRVGAMLLDPADPERVLGYAPHFIFGPEEVYERTGDVPNVVFPCGMVVEPDGTVKLYYGAADTCIGLAEARLDDLVRVVREGCRPPGP